MSALDEHLEALRRHEQRFQDDLTAIDQADGAAGAALLQARRNAWLGRKNGFLTDLMSRLGTLPPADRKVFGREVNLFKGRVESALDARAAALAARRRPAGGVDITLSGRRRRLGARHPLSLIRDEVAATFTRLGYQVLEGPEIEDDYHNFEALNMPVDHPARDMQDTLYLERPLVPATYDPPTRGRAPREPQPLTLLRTHTSAMQIRHMERHDPPVRLVAIGPVYRRDNLDLTHTPMFHQVEGLVVGPGVTLADLKGTLTSMAAALFTVSGGDDDARDLVRFRPSFFPYTEPSAEVDIRCIRCRGEGCPICKRTGWLEILGSGMVHPAVFEYVGYDPDEVTGFAFGMGIERVALLKWGVEDIRLFYENDLRFLEQFGS
jgi:phenylalanyl-tRNA synthetase alpha chain